MAAVAIKIYIVDAHASHRKVITGFLAKLRPDVIVDLHDMTTAMPADDFDWSQYSLLVLDSRLGKASGLDWLRQLKDKPGLPPVIYLSSQNNVDVAVQAMKLGAADFLTKKGMNPTRLKQVFGDVLPPKLVVDMMPEMKPLPEHYETQQYSMADTQILPPEVAQAEAESPPAEPSTESDRQATQPEPESIEDEEYWAEQTQILHISK